MATDRLSDGLEGASIRATLRLYVISLAILGPVALLLGALFGSNAAFTYTPVLSGALVVGQYSWRVLQKFQAWRTTAERMIVRFFDFTFALFLLAVGGPLLAVLSALVKLESRGPILLAQEYVGQGGRPITLYRLRTVIRDVLPEEFELEQWRAMPLLKVAGDSRVGPIGRWLRRTGLDELALLFNVLLGQLTFFGDTPPSRAEVRAGLAEVPREKPGAVSLQGVRWMTARADGVSAYLLDNHVRPLQEIALFATFVRLAVEGKAESIFAVSDSEYRARLRDRVKRLRAAT